MRYAVASLGMAMVLACGLSNGVPVAAKAGVRAMSVATILKKCSGRPVVYRGAEVRGYYVEISAAEGYGITEVGALFDRKVNPSEAISVTGGSPGQPATVELQIHGLVVVRPDLTSPRGRIPSAVRVTVRGRLTCQGLSGFWPAFAHARKTPFLEEKSWSRS
jgi:hypothetical protein